MGFYRGLNCYRLRDALDVDDEKDYKHMVTNILRDTPSDVKIIFDMKDVQQRCPVTVCTHSYNFFFKFRTTYQCNSRPLEIMTMTARLMMMMNECVHEKLC